MLQTPDTPEFTQQSRGRKRLSIHHVRAADRSGQRIGTIILSRPQTGLGFRDKTARD